jgi:uncharacterized integral membrane protein
MKRLLVLVIAIPVALLLLLLAVANRAPVTLSLDPFAREAPVIAFTAPFFVFLLGAIMLGVLLGGIATWLKQGYHRRNERLFKREADKLRQETERLKSSQSAFSSTLPVPTSRS